MRVHKNNNSFVSYTRTLQQKWQLRFFCLTDLVNFCSIRATLRVQRGLKSDSASSRSIHASLKEGCIMVARGLKRKLRGDDVRDPGWENQLQSVLNISIDKYQRDQALMEPSLLRSVLITNTLRQAKTHMEAVSGIENPMKKIQTHHPVTCFRQELGTPSGFEDMDDDFMEDLSLSTAITAILKNLDTALDGSSGSSAPQRSPLASVENLTVDRPCKRSPNKSLSNRLQDSVLDDLLLDFDTSICERELADHTFDLSADEFVKYLPRVPCLGNEIGFLHSM